MTSDSHTAAAGRSAEHAERLAVIALDWTGHRLPYLSGVLDAAGAAHRAISVVVDVRASGSDEWGVIAGRCDNRELIEIQPDEPHREVLARLAERFDRLIVLDADHNLPDIVRLAASDRTTRLTLQLMREPRLRSSAGEALSPKDRAVGMAKTTMLAALPLLSRGRATTHLLRSPLFEFTSPARQLERLGAITAIIDPVLRREPAASPDERRASAATPLAPDSDGSSVAILGRLDDRKFVVEHLAAWAHDESLHGTRLVLCGSSFADAEIAAGVTAARKAGAVIDFPDRFATDEEMDTAIRNAAAVLCTYRSDIPSGIAALAVSAGCPIIAMAETRLGQAAERHGVGAAISRVDGPGLASAISVCRDLDRNAITAAAASLHERATLHHFGAQLIHG